MTKTTSVILIPASNLSISPTNVRKNSDAARDAELKASILAHGVVQI